ncbi:MAG TPA: TonB-dependent receptor [Thermoanaerobaculia bacterium]|nr:TonB-dependent receptor [Thermoanaerobaculia bacterium]
MKTIIALMLFAAAAVQGASVTGIVRDPSGGPLPGVTLYLKGSPLTTVSDAKGAFTLEVDALPVTVVAWLDGFRPAEVSVRAGEETDVAIRLELAPMSETMTVRGKSTRSEASESSKFEMRPLDILRTPGAQADIFRALQTLPGVVKIDEGAGLFVRGGDASEVRVLLDGATLSHPFRYETPTGGQFGSVTPLLLEGLTFSTGGFSARYGNALSAVLDLRGLGKPSSSQLLVSAGLAGVATRDSVAANENSGLRLSGNLTTTSALFAVNGKPRDFDQQPDGWDVDASAHYESAAVGSVKVFALSQGERIGIDFQREGFDGFLHSSSRQTFVAASWKRLAGDWQLASALGLDATNDGVDAGVLDLNTIDRNISWRFDAVRALGATLLRTGADADSLQTRTAGTVSFRGGDFGGVSGTKSFDVDRLDTHAGAFGELERKIGIATVTAGVRTDRYHLLFGMTVDPRVNVMFAIRPDQHLRFAWGIFHQSPSPQYYDNASGAPALEAMKARHWIAGYELGAVDGPFFARLEAYDKSYSKLPLQSAAGGFTSDGFGWARGVDLYLQKKWTRVDVHAGASLLDAERRWTPYTQRDQFDLPSGTWHPDFDIPHTFNLSTALKITDSIDGGFAMTYASGRPHTPVIGATLTNNGYLPIYGPINSERLPPYVRCDANLSHRSQIGANVAVLYFVAVSNALGRTNFFDYSYSPDFTRRAPIISAHPRSFYFGMTVIK